MNRTSRSKTMQPSGCPKAYHPSWEEKGLFQFWWPWWPSKSSTFKEAKVWQHSSPQGSKIPSHDSRLGQLSSELGTRPEHSIRPAWEPSSSYSQSFSQDSSFKKKPSVLQTWCWTRVMLGRCSNDSSLTMRWTHAITYQWMALLSPLYFLRNLRKISNSLSSIYFSGHVKVLYCVHPSQGALCQG